MLTHEARLRVRYAETDQMGVVYYSNYLIWMEVGRVEYCKAVGFSYKEMEADDGVLLTVVEAHCRYLAPARYDEEIGVRTWIEESNTRAVRFGYEIRLAGADRILASGYTKHIFCGLNMRPARLPVKYRGLFGTGA